MKYRQAYRILSFFFFTLFFGSGVPFAQEDIKASPNSVERESEPTDIPRVFKMSNERHLQIFSSGDLYPRYIADSRRPQNSIQAVSILTSEVQDSGDSRFRLMLGGRFGLLKIFHPKDPEYGLEVSLEAGFLAEFNKQKGLDNNGWDGLYGLILTYRPSTFWAFKIASEHDSSHIGDEYIENTGAIRLHYTREEWVMGISCQPSSWLTVYAEFGNAYHKSCADQENVRIQDGIEIIRPLALFDGSSGLYGAVDMVFWEENDWDLSITVQTGIQIIKSESKKRWRFGVQYYHGRSHIGEFFQFRERYFCLGTWFDI